MNPLVPVAPEIFKVGTDRLRYFNDRLTKLAYGALLYCTKGEADITIDLKEYHIIPFTHIVLLPGTVISLISSSQDFSIQYFVFSGEMMEMACMRLEPSFIHYLKEEPIYTHIKAWDTTSIQGLIDATKGIYIDRENCFRNQIAQNLLQILLLNTYDKIQRNQNQMEMEGNSRKIQFFKEFIRLVRRHCTSQRDVAFYAGELCISTRYLSAISQAIGERSAKAIIDEFLMLEIKVALQSTNLSFKEIAEQYHFPDQSFFGRYFKKHTGMSPKEYKANKM